MSYIRLGEAARQLGVSSQTVRKWVDNGKLPHRMSPGGQRMVDISSYVTDTESDTSSEDVPRIKIFYCRVSQGKQKSDLERQISLAKVLYPNHEIISDIGSGIKWNRKGLNIILEKVANNEVDEVVVFHRDRLCRFGFELIERILKNNGTSLKIYSGSEGSSYRSSDEELSKDLKEITKVFSGKPDKKSKTKS